MPFVYRYYPTVREARERVRTGVTGPVRLLHGSYLQDWLLRPEDDNWRVEEQLGGASRAFADIGSHWCDLAEFVSGHRITRLCARTLTALPERYREPRRTPPSSRSTATAPPARSTTEDAALVQFETDGGAVGSTVISQISAGRKNRLCLELDGGEEALAFNQEEPEALWVGRREAATLLKRDPEHLTAAGARYATLPRRPPAGLRRLLRRVRRRDLRSGRAGEPRRRPAGLRRRPARRPAHRRGADVRARGALGRRGARRRARASRPSATRREAVGVRAQALEDRGDRVEVGAPERLGAEVQRVQHRRRVGRDLAPASP